ncbi:hypothetical protein A2U01_0110956, partial [Trifolium medium]|nr:hypothetical protein [Trifolium medium]
MTLVLHLGRLVDRFGFSDLVLMWFHGGVCSAGESWVVLRQSFVKGDE